jgi:hypothetical protein
MQELVKFSQDFHSSSWFIFISANRWFGIVLELISVAYLAVVTFSFLLLGSLAGTIEDKCYFQLYNMHIEIPQINNRVSSTLSLLSAKSLMKLTINYIFTDFESSQVGLAISSALNLTGVFQV